MFKIEAIEDFFKQIPTDIKGAILNPIKGCINFSGRSPRSDIFGFLMILGICTLLYVVLTVTLIFFVQSWTLMVCSAVFVGMMYLSLAARRLHDINKSGWWSLIFIVPYIGALLWLLLFFVEGNKGENHYGPDPVVQSKKK
ncbi:MAG: DUF805 domain-containing protein [Rickettsiales bacterium]|nr:DUF805 domain-containing protein [Rickettsiales bacterium]